MRRHDSAALLSPFIEQCDPDGDLGSWPRPVWHASRCGFCSKPVGLGDLLVVVSDREHSICYPQGRDDARAFLCHPDCGPGAGYWIPLNELAAEDQSRDVGGLFSAEAWKTHLHGKDWYNFEVWDAIDDAHVLAVRLRAEAKAKTEEACRLPTKPYQITQRPSRVSDNPRSISTRTRTRILERDNFRCRRCGAGPNDARLVIDHVVPVAKGGTADESNLQTLCHPCNSAKSDREPHQHDLKGAEGRGG